MSDNELNFFCCNVKKVMESHNLTDEEIMKIMHIGRKNLERIKNGILPKRVGIESAFLLADYLNINVCNLFLR